MKMKFKNWRACAAALALIPVLGAQPRLDWAISIHGNGNDQVTAMAADAQGNIYLTGSTTSFDLGTRGAFQFRRASSNLYAYDGGTSKMRPLFPPSPAPIFNLTTDSQHPGTLYAATAAGLLKTSDNGASWILLTGPIPDPREPWFVAVAPSQPNLLYAASGTSIFKSMDSGTTWKPAAPLPVPGDTIFSAGGITIDPADASRVFIGGLYFSRDGGDSWMMLSSIISCLTFDPFHPDTVYGCVDAGATTKLVKSTDHGQTFVDLNGPALNFPGPILADAKRPGTIYVSGSGDAGEGIFRSPDGGATWALAAHLEPQPDQLVQDTGTGASYAVAQSGRQILQSDDGFQTLMTVAQADVEFNALAVSGPGTLLVSTETREMFVSKLDVGGRIIFTTYVGGLFGSQGTAITVDARGAIYVAGYSSSPDFPVTTPIQPADQFGYGTYLLKLSGDGSRLEYSTRISVTGVVNALAVDTAGSVYLAGTAGRGYPTTSNAAQPNFFGSSDTGILLPWSQDAFTTRIAADGSSVIYSTYLGNGNVDRAWAIVLDIDNNAYVAGTKLWKLNPEGTALLWSTDFYPGEFLAAKLDRNGDLYACGGTAGPSPALYTSSNAFQTAPSGYGADTRYKHGEADAFVAEFSSAGDVLYSTLLGGSNREACLAIEMDEQGNAVVAGYTTSLDFPTRFSWQAPSSNQSGFLAKLNGDGSALLYSTYLGDARGFSAVALARPALGDIVVAGNDDDGSIFLNRVSENPDSP